MAGQGKTIHDAVVVVVVIPSGSIRFFFFLFFFFVYATITLESRAFTSGGVVEGAAGIRDCKIPRGRREE